MIFPASILKVNTKVIIYSSCNFPNMMYFKPLDSKNEVYLT